MKIPKASLTLFCFALVLAGCSIAPPTHPAGSAASGVAGDSLP
jgi:hypothetical protein